MYLNQPNSGCASGRVWLDSWQVDSAPRSLEAAPILLPTAGSAIRRQLDRYFERHGLQCRLMGEFEDSALMKSFPGLGAGLFPAPAALAKDLERQHGVRLLGALDGCEVTYFAIAVERYLEHPGVAAICRVDRG